MAPTKASKQLEEQKNKKHLFEYLVFLLNQWKEEMFPNYNEAFTKLKLQKILFLVATVKAQKDNCPLLEVFNNFYALPYGPVELDIYNAMNSNSFERINFFGNNCCSNNLNDSYFESLDKTQKKCMKEAIDFSKKNGFDYITKNAFALVDITHKWTSWQVAMQVAEMLGNKCEQMSTEDIINSTYKAYN